MPKKKDPRYQNVKKAYDAGEIKTFSDIFKYVPIEQFSEDTGISIERLKRPIKPKVVELPFPYEHSEKNKKSKPSNN